MRACASEIPNNRRSVLTAVALGILAATLGCGGNNTKKAALGNAGAGGSASESDASPGGSNGTCLGGGVPSLVFNDDFSADLRDTYWTVSQTTPNLFTVDTTQSDIRLTKTATNAGAGVQNVAVNLDLAALGGPVTGDFEYQIDFANAVIGSNGTDQVELHAHFDDASIFFDVYDNSDGPVNAHVWTGTIHAGFQTTATSGTLRIARAGATLSAYLSDQLVYSMAASTSSLTGVEFVLQLQPGSNDDIAVQYDNFHFQTGCVSH